MATSPVPLWAREMSPYHREPTARAVLFLAVLALLFSLWLQSQPTTESGQVVDRRDSPACAEMARLERHGVRDGASYQRAVRACYDPR